MSVADKGSLDLVDNVQINGEILEEKKSPPSSQRKPRINRRSFYLANSPFIELLAEKKPTQQASDINGCSDGTETKSINSSTKGVISLTNAKSQSGDSSDKTSSSKGSKIISLKKSPASDSLNTENKEKVTNEVPPGSVDPPPKKKHKPITWP